MNRIPRILSLPVPSVLSRPRLRRVLLLPALLLVLAACSGDDEPAFTLPPQEDLQEVTLYLSLPALSDSAAKRLGAKSVTGTDIDPQAVEAARENAVHNDAEADFRLPADMPEGQYDVVVANILSNPLKLLAPALLGRVKKGGALVLSGVLARQAEEVIEVYRKTDPAVKLSVWKEEDGWVCIAGRRE